MVVDQDAHPLHHLPNRSGHGSGTTCHDRQALVPQWAPLAHVSAHSRSDGHQAQPEGLGTIPTAFLMHSQPSPSRSAQGLDVPREAWNRLERSVEACIGHASRARQSSVPHARDQTSLEGALQGRKRGAKVSSASTLGIFGWHHKKQVLSAKICTQWTEIDQTSQH